MKTKKDVIFAAATAIFAVVAVAYTFWGGFNLGATISCTLLFILSTAYLIGKPCSPSIFSCACGILALLSSLVYTFSTDPVFRFLGVFLIPILISVYLIGLGGTGRYWQGSYTLVLDVLRTVFIIPFAHIGTAMKAIFTRKPGKSSGNAGKILLGLTASLPVLLIIIPLLIKADAAFSDLMTNIAEHFNLSETVAQIILGLAIAPFLFTVFYALKNKLDKPNPDLQTKINAFPKMNSLVVTSFLSAISVCYLIYLFAQLAYFFNGFAGILPNGWNVVDYAKRGFFEMSAIAAINLCVIFAASVAVRRQASGELPLSIKLLDLYISLFTLLLISTAQAKMFMYIRDFGMTRLRLLTSIFMWLLILVYLFVMIRLFVRRFPYMKAIVLSITFIFIAAWGLTPVQLDVNSIVCRYNISAYKNSKNPDRTHKLDIQYLSSLGASATPYLKELSEDSEIPEDLRQEAYTALTVRAAYSTEEKCTELRSYNFSKNNEQKVFETLTKEPHAKQ